MNTAEKIAVRRFRDLAALTLADGEGASEFYLTQEMAFALARTLHLFANDMMDNERTGKQQVTAVNLTQFEDGFVVEEDNG